MTKSAILAIDFGERRIGLALSDPSGMIASPLCTIDTKKVDNPIEIIESSIKENDVSLIVVGYPYDLNGNITKKGEQIDLFIKKLQTEIPDFPIEKVDESFSTVEAKEILHSRKRRRKRGGKEELDKIAATVFLQEYLNSESQ